MNILFKRYLLLKSTLSCRFPIEEGVKIPLTVSDKSKLEDLLKRPYFSVHSQWKQEVNVTF